MAEGRFSNLPRGSDSLTTWSSVRDRLTTEEQREETEILVNMIGPLITRRKQLGMTQEQVAEKAGIKQSNLARIENGATVPKISTLYRIAKALNCQIVYYPLEEKSNQEAAAASAM